MYNLVSPTRLVYTIGSLSHSYLVLYAHMQYTYIHLFAVARWLLSLLSDYKSATCSERLQFVIRQRLYLIGEQEYI